MTNPRHPVRHGLLTGVAAAVLLAACGGGVDSDEQGHGHEAVTLDTAGRLATTEANAATLRIHDLDSGQVEASHVLQHTPAALFASPGGRYAVAFQAAQGQLQFVDGGVWQEDHGDHLHDYKQASAPVAFRLTGTAPSHYNLLAGSQAAVYFDGSATATPAINASLKLLTDASIGAATTAATLDLTAPLHGFGEPMGNKLISVKRAADAPDALPTHLALHTRSSNGYAFARDIAGRCDGMHGSFSSGSSTLVGCTDGMLLVRHLSATTVGDGQKLTTPLRVATVVGHPRLPDQFIGVATEGAAPAPVTTRFYAVDGATATVSSFVPQGWDSGRVRRAHGFDRSGQRFFIVDDQGTLTVAQRQGGAWAPLARVTGAIPTMPRAAPWPAITANGAKDEIYITDPVARQLVVVNSLSGAVQARRDLGFTPSNAVWLGITR